MPVTPAVLSVAAMYAAFTVVGWLASRKARNGTAADLIVAGRQMPLWMAALTMTATWVDGGSMLSWNCLKRLMWPSLTTVQMARVIRLSILLFGAVAAAFALKVRSVQALWFFTSDLVFVLLFPQLVFALFDGKANRIGSVAAFGVSLLLRLGGGEPLLGIPHFIPYPELFAAVLPEPPTDWYDPATGAMLFPFKTFAAAAGVIVLPAVSRLTARWEAPRPLCNPSTGEGL